MTEKISDPSRGQNEETIGAFLAVIEVGSEVAIRNPHGGQLYFRLATVTDIGVGTRVRYLYTNIAGDFGGNAWYKKSGKNGKSSGGQTRLVEPTPEVRQFIADHPHGVSGVFGRDPGGEIPIPWYKRTKAVGEDVNEG